MRQNDWMFAFDQWMNVNEATAYNFCLINVRVLTTGFQNTFRYSMITTTLTFELLIFCHTKRLNACDFWKNFPHQMNEWFLVEMIGFEWMRRLPYENDWICPRCMIKCLSWSVSVNRREWFYQDASQVTFVFQDTTY